MAEETTNKKTGMTPIVDTEDLNGGRVHGVVPCTTVMIKFRDGRTGRDEVRLAVVVPGGEMYFFPTRQFEPAQKWIRNAVVKELEKKLKTAPGATSIEITEVNEDTVQV
jgi:hypothetical protein